MLKKLLLVLFLVTSAESWATAIAVDSYGGFVGLDGAGKIVMRGKHFKPVNAFDFSINSEVAVSGSDGSLVVKSASASNVIEIASFGLVKHLSFSAHGTLALLKSDGIPCLFGPESLQPNCIASQNNVSDIIWDNEKNELITFSPKKLTVVTAAGVEKSTIDVPASEGKVALFNGSIYIVSSPICGFDGVGAFCLSEIYVLDKSKNISKIDAIVPSKIVGVLSNNSDIYLYGSGVMSALTGNFLLSGEVTHLTADGDFIYALNASRSEISIVDVRRQKVANTVFVGGSFSGSSQIRYFHDQSNITRVFNWLEMKYAAVLKGDGALTQSSGTWVYRHYPLKQAYIGTQSGRLYLMLSGELIGLGDMSEILQEAISKGF